MVNQNRRTKILIIQLFILNLVDTIATLKLTEGLSIMELNPLLAPLVGIPILFIVMKVVIGLICCLILFNYSSHKLVKWLIGIPVTAYLTVIMIHFVYIL